jgi:hypothetical protein
LLEARGASGVCTAGRPVLFVHANLVAIVGGIGGIVHIDGDGDDRVFIDVDVGQKYASGYVPSLADDAARGDVECANQVLVRTRASRATKRFRPPQASVRGTMLTGGLLPVMDIAIGGSSESNSPRRFTSNRLTLRPP